MKKELDLKFTLSVIVKGEYIKGVKFGLCILRRLTDRRM